MTVDDGRLLECMKCPLNYEDGGRGSYRCQNGSMNGLVRAIDTYLDEKRHFVEVSSQTESKLKFCAKERYNWMLKMLDKQGYEYL